MHHLLQRALPVLVSLPLLGGCLGAPGAAPGADQAGLLLTSDILAGTDVAGFVYTVTQVDCDTGEPVVPPFTATASEDLADAVLPGGGGLTNAPYDGGSQHLFADHFFWLPEGCYDVEVVPVDADGNPSEDCYPSHADGVPVVDGQVTEILLINQCKGEPFGGLDVIATLNHPPTIVDLWYDEGKFTCDEVTVCIEVDDPDFDPLLIRWKPPQGGTMTGLTEEPGPNGTTIFCATFSFEKPGDYEVSAVVYDMAWDAAGNPVPIETLLAQQGDAYPSNDTITFPVHVLDDEACMCTCPEGFEPTPAGDECIRITNAPAQASQTIYQVCKAETNPNYSRDGAQYPGGTIVENSFWGESYNDLDSRLNTVGVWACDPTQINTYETYATTTPTQEWIGFSVCLEIEEAGDYIVGLGADNRMRFSLNGTLLEDWNTNATTNFTYWWNKPLPLNSGLNIVTLEGWNQSQAASFGAEIAGPFPTGSLVDDASMIAADYENNILWSTLDVILEPFTIGETSGYTCEEGWVVNTCADTPVCTLIERVPCE
ncbi:MAG: hypothetical protein H6732_11180 [Alphaproteobacteria bacterium]|nr:hypothetical protein [Alphaproteobacteria bacterium]